MKKAISLLLAVITAMSLTTLSFAAESPAAVDKGDIVVLYTNDVHCGVDDSNHEFDYGMDQFFNLSKALKSGYICANFMDLRTNKPVFDAYKMITYGDTKVAYVGIDTPESITKSTPTYFQDNTGKYIYGFCAGNNGKELYTAVQSAVDSAKTAGADYVIAVGHLGDDAQSAPWRSADVIANVSGLTAFLDGHAHSVIESQKVADKDGKTVLLTSTGTKLAAIGKLVIKSTGAVSTELVTDYPDKDPTIDTFVKGIQAKNDALLNKVVAKTSVDLTTLEAAASVPTSRQATSPMGRSSPCIPSATSCGWWRPPEHRFWTRWRWPPAPPPMKTAASFRFPA